MQDIVKIIFQRKKPLFDRLEEYGFGRGADGEYVLAMPMKCGFWLDMRVDHCGNVRADVIDPGFDERYTLHLTDAAGEFVGGVRCEYEEMLRDVAENCFEDDIFKSPQTARVIGYIREKYGRELEFLWEKLSDSAIWRREDNEKWFGVLLIIKRSKLGLSSEELAEVMDLRCPPEEMAGLVDGARFFPGWHMNKKHWFTVILDDSVEDSEVFRLIDRSYEIAKKK